MAIVGKADAAACGYAAGEGRCGHVSHRRPERLIDSQPAGDVVSRRFEILEGISHWIAEEAPEVLNSLMLNHIGTH